MKLRTISEATFPNGREFYSYAEPCTANPSRPVMTARQAARVRVAYHYSTKPDLHQTGIKTRYELGLRDLTKAPPGERDSTYQNAVYLSIRPDIQCVDAPYLYKIDLTQLDRSYFKGDEDAVGHCDGISSEDDWISSIMCMGSFRYEGSIPPEAVTPS